MAEFTSDFKLRSLEKERQKQFQEKLDTLAKLKEDAQKGVVDIQQKFDKHKNVREEVFKQQTIGLVTLEDFKKKRIEVEQADDPLKLNKETKKRKSKVESHKLSFDFGEEEEEEEEENTAVRKKSSLGKDPNAETSFLPDKEREEAEKLMRVELAKEWKLKQDKIKAEPIEIQYSYHIDGKDQIRSVTVKKGISIQAFLELCKPEFKELKSVSTNDLLFVNKDFIVPQHHTLYDLLLLDDTIKSNNNQKLFDFREKTENSLERSPNTKIVERRWYEKNSNVYPYTQWKTFESSLYT